MSSVSENNLLHTRQYGRGYFIEQLKARLAKRYLGRLSRQLLARGHFQVATFAFDLIGHQINLRGAFELEELTSVMEWLKRNNRIRGHAVDVGANIGNHSLFFSKYFARIYSFEPNRNTFKLLEYNASLAGNVECFNVGLSDHEGTANLIVEAGNVGASRVGADFGALPCQTIELRKLDAFPAIDASEIGLLKLDVEGLELAVLKGSQRVIRKHRPIILFEQHPGDFVDGQSAVVEYLKDLGYRNFATVMPAPYISTAMPGFLRNPMTTLLRILCGLSYRIVKHESLSPGFYAFVIALPDETTGG